MINTEFQSGFVAVIGKPNVGKSSIINALIREKVAIVSPKPQTTRNKILGILNGENYQVVFNDTPGIIKPQNVLNQRMMKDVLVATSDVDCVLFVVSAEYGLTENELALIEKYASKSKVVVAVNKMDLVNYEKVFPFLSKLNAIPNIADIVPVSAKTSKNLDELVKVLLKYIPVGPAYFSRDEYTDKSIRFIASEIIREKALWYLNDEIPHGINVEIVKFEELAGIINIDAEITVEKPTHKSIVIGANGSKLKEIAAKSRLELEKLCDKKVFLQVFVKVKEGWRDNKSLLDSFGYSDHE